MKETAGGLFKEVKTAVNPWSEETADTDRTRIPCVRCGHSPRQILSEDPQERLLQEDRVA